MIALAIALSTCRDTPLNTKPLDKQTPCELGMIGTFRHGAWDGVCHRDGNLSGFDHEFCRAWWHRDKAIEVQVERTTHNLSIFVSGRSCARHVSRDIATSRLRDAGRVMLLAHALRAAAAHEATQCRTEVPRFDASEIAAVLRETDDLVDLGS